MIGPEKLGPLRCHQHHRPAGLAVADDGRFAFGIRMQLDHALEEDGLGADDVFDGLSRNWGGQEADEIARMPCLEDYADLALRLEPADARSVPRARVDDDERSLARIDFDAGRRCNAHEHVVDRTLEIAPVHDEFAAEFQNMRRDFGCVFLVALAALLKHVEEEYAALPCVGPIFARIFNRIEIRWCDGRIASTACYTAHCGSLTGGWW